jgi:hypothetical protein
MMILLSYEFYYAMTFQFRIANYYTGQQNFTFFVIRGAKDNLWDLNVTSTQMLQNASDEFMHFVDTLMVATNTMYFCDNTVPRVAPALGL